MYIDTHTHTHTHTQATLAREKSGLASLSPDISDRFTLDRFPWRGSTILNLSASGASA